MQGALFVSLLYVPLTQELHAGTDKDAAMVIIYERPIVCVGGAGPVLCDSHESAGCNA